MKRLIVPSILFAIIYSMFLSPLPANEIQDGVDRALRCLRMSQNADGSYGQPGEEYIVTPLTVLAFGTSPRKYTDLDGPFVRRAVEWIVARQEEDGSQRDGSGADIFKTTAISVAAVASVNKFKWSGYLGKGAAFMLNALEKEPFAPERSFYTLLASKIIFPSGMEDSSIKPSEVRIPQKWPDAIYPLLWTVALGQDLPKTLDGDKLVGSIDEELTRDHSNLTMVWAGTYLLSILVFAGGLGYLGVSGFTGIKLYTPSNDQYSYFGTAFRVNINEY